MQEAKVSLLIALPLQLMENGVIMENGVHAMLTAAEERRPAPRPALTLLLPILVTNVREMLTTQSPVTKTLVQVEIENVMPLQYLTCLSDLV